MANPRLSLKEALKEVPEKETEEHESSEPAINEMVEKVFTTRTLAHFAHMKTNSYASHIALNELYDSIVDEVDNIVETYQGEFGLLEGLECEGCEQPKDILSLIKQDATWIKTNREKIANGSKTIENLIDGLNGTYNKVIYKLTNLS